MVLGAGLRHDLRRGRGIIVGGIGHVGRTRLPEGRRPEEIFSTVNRYTTTVSAIVEKHGGSIVEFNGDGMMAIVIDAATWRSAGTAVSGFERREQVTIRGRSQREDIYLLPLRAGGPEAPPSEVHGKQPARH